VKISPRQTGANLAIDDRGREGLAIVTGISGIAGPVPPLMLDETMERR
jgi:hypothetical protein